MTFEPVRVSDVLIGHVGRRGPLTFFFGTARGTRDLLATAFPSLEFCEMKQVHGRAVADAEPTDRPAADALGANQIGRAPIVVTADCVPVLIASRARVVAVHAGWRGVAADVVGAALDTFKPNDPPVAAAIGPHLNVTSFEVGRDVADQLLAAAPTTARALTRPHASDDKVYFDLTAVVRAQLRRDDQHVAIDEFTVDTLTSSIYHSYRRRPLPVGRNLSFVVRNG